MKQRRVVLRRSKIIAVLSALVASAILVTGSLTAMIPSAQAADLSKFQPGNIISDALFYDANALSEAGIQSFLNSKVSTCAAGKTCLKSFKQSTYTRPADAVCSSYVGAANESAARIIYKVAQACGISPKVILVMLQKEQNLVLSSEPTSWAWQASMGFACPDTAACDSKYFGFYNQVYMGAWQLKRYGNPPGTSNYFTWLPVGKVSQVRYSPTASCGSSAVYIENKATAALYYYTPYQPNASALAAGYGSSSDQCAAYGNRNFFNYYSDWFGSPAAPVDPMAYIDSASLVETAGAASIQVSGWAVDRAATTKSIEVHMYLDLPDGSVIGRAVVANGSRPDVAGAYPGAGDKHGYSASFPITKAGKYQLCLFPMTSVGSTLLGCRTFEAKGAAPAGAFDSAAMVQADGKASLQVSGWGMNMSSMKESSEMNFYVASPRGTVKGYAVPANQPRADIDRVFPGAGTNHGFAATFPITESGTYQVCAYVNVASPYGSSSTSLGCRNVVAKASAPFGSFDYVSQSGASGVVTLSFGGWAVDSALPTTPINVDVYVDRPNGTTVGVRTSASAVRSDIGRAYPDAGSAHGFAGSTVATVPGTYKACAFAIGTSAFGGASSLLGCRTITVSSAAVAGAFDSASVVPAVGGNSAEVRGWAVDPSSPTKASYVDVYVDAPDGSARGYRLLADKTRTDIARIFPQYGAAHGLVGSVPLNGAGKHVICAYGIPASQFGQTAAFGCKTVVVG